MAVATVSKVKHPHPLILAIRESTRFELLNIGSRLFLFILISVAFAISWTGHNAGLQMMVTSIGTFIMYLMCVWHSVHVKGVWQTVAFFVLSWVIAFTAEYLGANYGLIFGQYDYTSMMGPRVGESPCLFRSAGAFSSTQLSCSLTGYSVWAGSGVA